MRDLCLKSLMMVLLICGTCSPLLVLWHVWPRTVAPEPIIALGTSPMLVDVALALVLPLQHSLWTQRPVKRLMLRLFSAHFERPMYVIGSAAALVTTGLLWQPVDHALWQPGTLGLWVMRGLLIVSLLLQAWSAELVGGAHLNGTAHVRAALAEAPVPEPVFQARGLYRVMRHPIASSQVLMVWSVGTVRLDLAMLAGIWTVWIVLATALEERRLLADLGEVYAKYRETTGFLLPRFGRS
ncbi:MAG: methyltransferase family protein [Bradymonadia bacterium]